MRDRSNHTIIGQTAPHAAYTLISLLGVVFDIVVLFSAIFVALGLMLIGTTLLLPVFIWLVDVIGYPPNETAASFFADVRDLNIGTFARILVLLPPIILIVFREHIARPFRSFWGLCLAFILCLPGLEVLWLVIAYIFGFAEHIHNPWALTVMLWLMSQAGSDPSSMQSVAVSLLLFSVLFSGLLFLPYIIIYLI